MDPPTHNTLSCVRSSWCVGWSLLGVLVIIIIIVFFLSYTFPNEWKPRRRGGGVARAMVQACSTMTSAPAVLGIVVLGVAAFAFGFHALWQERSDGLVSNRGRGRTSVLVKLKKRYRGTKRSIGYFDRIGSFLKCWTHFVTSESVVVRTASRSDAELYSSLLLAYRKQYKETFSVTVEEAPELVGELQIVACKRELCSRRQNHPFSYVVPTADENGHPGVLQQFTGAEKLLLCRIKLPEERFSRDIPPFVFRVLAAHSNNYPVFTTYAAEVRFYTPLIEEIAREYQDDFMQHAQGDRRQQDYQQVQHRNGSASYPTNGTTQELLFSTSFGGSFASAIQLKAQGLDAAVINFLGELIDVNAALFTSLLLGCDSNDDGGVDTTFYENMSNRMQMDEEPMHNIIREELVNTLFVTPSQNVTRSPSEKMKQNPLGVWRASRQSMMTTAMLYVIDVAAANDGPMVCYSRVVDEVVFQAVVVYHSASLLDFIEAVASRFEKRYTPHSPALRKAIEDRRRHEDQCQDGTVKSGSQSVCGEEVSPEEFQEILGELPHISEFMLEHRIVFYNAAATPLGSNLLEEVFGVPATVFPFLPCARESVAFITQSYNCIVETYGSLDSSAFGNFRRDVFNDVNRAALSSSQRCFRALNKSRSGTITFEELCRWMACKLSIDTSLPADARLLSIAMSLGLPLALLLQTRDQWFHLERAPRFSGVMTGGY